LAEPFQHVCGAGKPAPYKAFWLVVGNGLARSAPQRVQTG